MAFGGKKAAPFVSGGGRKKASTKTAKGAPKKNPPKGKGGNTTKAVGGQGAAPTGTSPSTAIGGGQFVSKGKKRRSASANPSMRGQAGMLASNQAK